MHIASCFDSKESSSRHSMNHNIDISSDSGHDLVQHIRMTSVKVVGIVTGLRAAQSEVRIPVMNWTICVIFQCLLRRFVNCVCLK
jgi:hypothetical protein